MTEYRLYLYEGVSRVSAVALVCADDGEAKARALDRAHGRQAALWRGPIFVAGWPATPSPQRA